MFQNFLIASGYSSSFSLNPIFNAYYPSLCYNNQNILMYPTSTSIQFISNQNTIQVPTKPKRSTNKYQKKSKTKKTKIKDIEFKVKTQNAKRNVISNIVHHLVSFIQRKIKSLPIVQRIIKTHNLSIIPEDFYEYINTINLKNYVRLETLQAICKGQTQFSNKNKFQISKLFRIITCYFLNSQCFISIQQSKKIRSTLKDEHYKKRRQMLKMIAQLQ